MYLGIPYYISPEQVFDEDGSGQMDFCEYMLAVQSAKLETPEDKLKWIFRMYDRVRELKFRKEDAYEYICIFIICIYIDLHVQNYSNSIETDELSCMFWTLFEVTGVKVTETQMEMLVTDVMQTLDEDGNGSIDITEFVEGSLKTKFIYDLLCST